MSRFICVLVAAAGVVSLAAPAEAGDHGRHHGGGHDWGNGGHHYRSNDHVKINIGVPYYGGRHCNDRPVYYAPQPVYYAPAPVYYVPQPQPVYYYTPGGFSFNYYSR